MKPLLLNKKSWSLRFIATMNDEQEYLNFDTEGYVQRYLGIKTSCDILKLLMSSLFKLIALTIIVLIVAISVSFTMILTGTLYVHWIAGNISFGTLFSILFNSPAIIVLILASAFVLFLLIVFLFLLIVYLNYLMRNSSGLKNKIPQEMKQLYFSFKEKVCIPVVIQKED
jgi:hypothetical protein